MLTQTVLAPSPRLHPTPTLLQRAEPACPQKHATFGLIGVAMSVGRNMEIFNRASERHIEQASLGIRDRHRPRQIGTHHDRLIRDSELPRLAVMR